MIRLLTAFVCLALLMTLNSEAATPHAKRRSSHHTSNHRKPAQKTQPPFSFIPAKQPLESIVRLQQPLTGRIVQQQSPPATFQTTLPIAPIDPAPSAPENFTPVPIKPASHSVQANFTSRKGLWKRVATLFSETKGALPTLRPEVLTSGSSWVDPFPAVESTQLAEAVAQLIQGHLPNQQRSLAFAQPPQSQSGNSFSAALEHTLQQAGYTIAGPHSLVANAHQIRYRVTPLNQWVLIRVRIDDTELSRLYERTYTGALAAASPLTRLSKGAP